MQKLTKYTTETDHCLTLPEHLTFKIKVFSYSMLWSRLWQPVCVGCVTRGYQACTGVWLEWEFIWLGLGWEQWEYPDCLQWWWLHTGLGCCTTPGDYTVNVVLDWDSVCNPHLLRCHLIKAQRQRKEIVMAAHDKKFYFVNVDFLP